MNNILEIKFSGWTATPRLPFVLSGNAVCMPVPSYSLLLGLIGCCLGRIIQYDEVNIGYNYTFDSVAKDRETRQRLEFNKQKIKIHSKGSDTYLREFHTSPKLILWLNRIDWVQYFSNPIGTPALGRSQDILKIENVRIVEVNSVSKGTIAGCMLPFAKDLKIGGQLVQLAEAYMESEEIGGGRIASNSKIFITIPEDNEQEIVVNNLFQLNEKDGKIFYLHNFGND